MRTTVTLEPDIAKRLKEYARRNRTSLKAALNAALRRGLAALEPAASPRLPFVVVPHSGGFKPGFDVAKLDQLSDQLETDEFIHRSRR